MFENVKPHLRELRDRIIISFLALIAGVIIAFTFHNPILKWMTQPLNNALKEVGKKIEKQEATSWKIKSEANITLSKSQIALGNSIKSAKKLSDSLDMASKLESNNTLKSLLAQASKAANELAINSKILKDELLKDELNGTIAKESIREASFNGMITTHKVGGAFFVALKVSIFAGIIIALPIILWQIWLFVAPALYDDEKKKIMPLLIPFIFGGSIMFILGVLFAYYVVTPFGFQFLITFGSFLYTPLINIEDYVGFFTKILLGFGISFELPVFSYFLAKMGLITDRTLKDYFRYAIVIIFIIAAILTPPDVLTQLLMAFPLIALYGVSIIIVSYVNPEKDDDLDDFDKIDEEFENLEKDGK